MSDELAVVVYLAGLLFGAAYVGYMKVTYPYEDVSGVVLCFMLWPLLAMILVISSPLVGAYYLGQFIAARRSKGTP